MANQKNDFRALMRRAAAGDQQAEAAIVDEYGDAVRHAVQRALNSRLRRKFDSMDFVQHAWQAVFQARERLERVQSPAELVAFLIVVAGNKVRAAARHDRLIDECSLDAEDRRGNDTRDEAEGIADHGPAAIDVAIAKEGMEILLFHEPRIVRQMIVLRLAGLNDEQIACTLHVSRSFVSRCLKRLARKVA